MQRCGGWEKRVKIVERITHEGKGVRKKMKRKRIITVIEKDSNEQAAAKRG